MFHSCLFCYQISTVQLPGEDTLAILIVRGVSREFLIVMHFFQCPWANLNLGMGELEPGHERTSPRGVCTRGEPWVRHRRQKTAKNIVLRGNELTPNFYRV